MTEQIMTLIVLRAYLAGVWAVLEEMSDVADIQAGDAQGQNGA